MADAPAPPLSEPPDIDTLVAREVWESHTCVDVGRRRRRWQRRGRGRGRWRQARHSLQVALTALASVHRADMDDDLDSIGEVLRMFHHSASVHCIENAEPTKRNNDKQR